MYICGMYVCMYIYMYVREQSVTSAKGGCVIVASVLPSMPAHAHWQMPHVWSVREVCGNMVDASSNALSVTASCVKMTSLSTRPAARNWRERISSVS